MIVRIMGYGQYELGEEAVAELHAADEEIEAAAAADDPRAFALALEDLVAVVLRSGRLVEPGVLVSSEAIVPAPGTSLADARRLLSHSGEGLVPDPR